MLTDLFDDTKLIKINETGKGKSLKHHGDSLFFKNRPSLHYAFCPNTELIWCKYKNSTIPLE